MALGPEKLVTYRKATRPADGSSFPLFVDNELTRIATVTANIGVVLANRVDDVKGDLSTTIVDLQSAHARITEEASIRETADGVIATRTSTIEAQYESQSVAFDGLSKTVTEATGKIEEIRQVSVTNTESVSTLKTTMESGFSAQQIGIDGALLSASAAHAAIEQEAQTRTDAVSAVASRTSNLEVSYDSQQGALGDLDGRVSQSDARITEVAKTTADAVQAVATRTATLEASKDDITSRVTTTENAVAGLQGNAQWKVAAEGPTGTTSITVDSANGVEIVGNVKIDGSLTVDGTISTAKLAESSITTPKVADNAISSFVSVDGLSGELGSTMSSTLSAPCSITTAGGVVRIDVNFDVVLIPGQNPNFFMQLRRNGTPITRSFQLNSTSSTNGGFPAFFTIVDTPPAGPNSYTLYFGRYVPPPGSGPAAAGIRYAYGGIYAQEFKK